MRRSRNGGFTAVELLIVAILIALLAAIGLPVFHNQLERAKIAVDQANMHSAYTAFSLALLTGDAERDRTYYYDPLNMALLTVRPEGYGRSGTDASEWWTGIGSAEGVPCVAGVPGVISLRMGEKNAISFLWSIGDTLIWKTLPGRTIQPVEGEQNPFYWFDGGGTAASTRKDTHEHLMLIDNRKRAEADRQILDAIADYFETLSPNEAKEILGNHGYSMARLGGTPLFRYMVTEDCAILLEPSEAASNVDYLKMLGYAPKVGGREPLEIRKELSVGGKGGNYVDTYLFTSDDVIANPGVAYEVCMSLSETFGTLESVETWIVPVSKH